MKLMKLLLFLIIKSKIITIENNIVLDDSFQPSIIENMYTLFSQIERQLTSKCVKQKLIVAKENDHLSCRKDALKRIS